MKKTKKVSELTHVHHSPIIVNTGLIYITSTFCLYSTATVTEEVSHHRAPGEALSS